MDKKSNYLQEQKKTDGIVMVTKYRGNSIHKDSLSVGQEFQDFVIEYLSKNMGISISIFSSKKYQYNIGESVQGVEIKYDARSTGDCTYEDCKATNNVAIEVAEKTDSDNINWIPSGIRKNDNAWLYIVGNYNYFWIFSKKLLCKFYSTNKYRIVQTLPTIRDMLIPILDADEHCIRKITIINTQT